MLSGNSHTIRLILKGVVYDSAGSRAPREPGNRPDWLTPAHCHHPGGASSRGHSPPPPAPPAPAPTGLCARPAWTCLPRTFPTESITACGLARLASRYGRMTFHVRMAQSDLPLSLPRLLRLQTPDPSWFPCPLASTCHSLLLLQPGPDEHNSHYVLTSPRVSHMPCVPTPHSLSTLVAEVTWRCWSTRVLPTSSFPWA